MKNKSWFRIMLALLAALMFVFVAACGEDGKQGNDPGGDPGGDTGEDPNPPVEVVAKPADYDYYDYGEYLSIAKYKGTDKDIMLPHEYNGKPVKHIYINHGAGAEDLYKPFYHASFETVRIPASITEFYGDFNPFCYATNLKNIVVAPDNPVFSSEDGVLYDKQKTKVIACPYKKTGTLNLPDTVKEVPTEAMQCFYASGEESEHALNSDFKNFGRFSSQITGIRVPAGIELLELEGCRQLQSCDLSGTNMTELPQAIFRQCLSLKSVKLPASLKYIGTGAFQNSGLESIELAPTVRCLNYFYDPEYPELTMSSQSTDVFAGCKALKSVTGPAQAFFGERDSEDLSYSSGDWGKTNQFIGCTALESITVNGAHPGKGGTAWAISDYEKGWVPDPKSITFTALKTLTYQNGCYDLLNDFNISSFAEDYPNVQIVKS